MSDSIKFNEIDWDIIDYSRISLNLNGQEHLIETDLVQPSKHHLSKLTSKQNSAEEEFETFSPETEEDKQLYKRILKQRLYGLELDFRETLRKRTYYLIGLYNTELDLSLKKIPDLEKHYELDKTEHNRILKNLDKRYTSERQNKIEKRKYFKSKGFKTYLQSKNDYFKFKNNLDHSKAKVLDFLDTYLYSDLNSALKYLQTARGLHIEYECKDCGHKDIEIFNLDTQSKRFTPVLSRQKFCAYTLENKYKKIRHQLALRYEELDIRGKTQSLMTFPFSNLPYSVLNSDEGRKCILSVQKILKEWNRYKIKQEDIFDVEGLTKNGKIYKINSKNYEQFIGKRISEVYTGYYDVIEVKEYASGSKRKDGTQREELEFNFHIHRSATRSKSLRFGRFDSHYASPIFAKLCEKYGYGIIKDTKLMHIGASHLKKKFDNKSFNVANYMCQYITKGIDVSSIESMRLLNKNFKGIHMFRSGGDLASKYLNNSLVFSKIKRDMPNYSYTAGSFTTSYTPFPIYRKQYLEKKSKCSCILCGGDVQFSGHQHLELKII